MITKASDNQNNSERNIKVSNVTISDSENITIAIIEQELNIA